MPATYPGVGGVGAGAPGIGMAAVVPSDSADLPMMARSLFVTGAGAVAAIGADGQPFTITVPANFILPVQVARVKAAGTTATGIFAIW